MFHPALSFTPDSQSSGSSVDPEKLAELDEDGRMGRQIRERLTGGEGGTK